MSRIFLSHASQDDFEAAAIRSWLAEAGWDDVFLDFDPDRGIAAGERWEKALHAAATRCEAVIFLISAAWLASGWCRKEYQLAHGLNKKLFGVIIDRDQTIAGLPGELVGTWQVIDLAHGQDLRTFEARPPGREEQRAVSFTEEGLRRLRRGLEKAGLDPDFFAWPPAGEPDRTPYRGLKPLEAADAGVFFGRDAPIVEAIDHLRGLAEAAAPRLFVLLGASGAGKSSFLRAGLLPRLQRDDATFLPLPPIRPERAALSGENGLVRALQAVFPTRSRESLLRAIEGGAAALRPLFAELAAGALARQVPGEDIARRPAIVVAIDQAEELLRGDQGDEGARLLAILRDLATADEPAVIVIFAIRSDAYDGLERARALEGLRQTAMPLLPMPRAAYKEVIEGPARRFNEAGGRLAIDPQLTARLLEDLERGGGADALPLLAFTLEQLYLEHGRDGMFRPADYDAFGGYGGAIEAAVRRSFARADADPRIPADRQARDAILRRGLIPWLAGIDPDTKAPRRNIARRDDLPEEALPLVDLLVEERLLAIDTVEAPDPATGEMLRTATVEPAHEALLRQWPLLEGWLAEDFALLAALEGAQRAARDWQANGRIEAWLAHQGQRLAEAEELDARPDITAKLGPQDRAYLAACRLREEQLREAEEQRQREREDEQARRLADAHALAAADRKTTQRTRIGLAAAIVLALAAGAFGVYAQTQRKAAQLALATATDTANTLIGDLARQFQGVTGMPAALVKSIFDRALKLQSDLIGAGQTSPALRQSQATGLSQASATLITVGDTGGARSAAGRSIGVWRDLVGAQPGDLGLQRGLANALDNLGYASMLAGDPPAALAAFTENLDIVRRVARAEPTPHNRNLLASALQRLGDAKSASSDLPGALAAYEESLATFREIDKDTPSKDVQSNIAHGLDRIGQLKLILGDRNGALAALTEGLSIRREIAKDATDASAQRDLAWTLGQIGTFREEQSDYRGALAADEEALAIRRGLARDKTNARAQRDFASSLRAVAIVKLKLGDVRGALAQAEESLAMARALSRDAANVESQRDLAEALHTVGDVKAEAGDPKGALAAYEESLGIYRTVSRQGGERNAARDLALILDSIGELKLASGDQKGALAAYEEGLTLRREVVKATPTAEAERDLGIGLSRIGSIRLQDEDVKGALGLYEESLGLFRKLAESGNAQARRDLVLALNDIGNAKATGDDFPGALAAFEESLSILRDLARTATLPTTRRDTAALLNRMGKLKGLMGDPKGALAAMDECLALLKELDGGKTDARSRRELSSVAEEVGKMKLEARDWPGAAVAFEVGLEPLRGLASGGDAKSMQALVVALNQIGGMKLQTNDLAGALAAFEEGEAVARKLGDSPQAHRNLSYVLDNVGLTQEKLGHRDAAFAAFEESLKLRQALADADASDAQARLDLAFGLEHLAGLQKDVGKLDEAFAGWKAAIEIRKNLSASGPMAETLRVALRRDYSHVGGIAFHDLLARRFQQALEAADYALAGAPDMLWIQSNRAHALMFLGRTEEARAIYLAHRGQQAQKDQTWEQAVLGDFAEFRKIGLTTPLMDEIERKLLQTG